MTAANTICQNCSNAQEKSTLSEERSKATNKVSGCPHYFCSDKLEVSVYQFDVS